MKKGWLVVLALFVIIIVGLIVLIVIPAPNANAPTTTNVATTTTPSTTTGSLADTIVVDSPKPNTALSSPLTVTGKARGSWYFEASAPIKLVDVTGKTIAQGHITAQGDWMTSDFVPFTATLTFTKPPAGTKAKLVLLNDNPSGDPTKQKELDIPVRF